MHVSSSPTQFKSWNSPHLLTNQFQLLIKLITTLNTNVPPENNNYPVETLKELELTTIQIFSHQMLPSWLALAKSYYPFYSINDKDKALIEGLEFQLKSKAYEHESLSALIKKLFLSKLPKVNSQYQEFIDNITTVIAKLTAVALSTPALLNDAHQRDRQKYEEAGPSMSNCISPIETIIRHMMSRKELDKAVVISAFSLLVQVKTIKSHFEQLSLIQQVEKSQIDNKKLDEQLKRLELGLQKEEQNEALAAWQSKEEQLALFKIFKLRKKLHRYREHLTEVLAQNPQEKNAQYKRASLNLLETVLNDNKCLPSQRIITFKMHLADVQNQLSEHRDPLWMRFLRDCLRIVGLTFSGIALYRKLSEQPVNFFKPSRGQEFLAETNRLINSVQDFSLQH
ncbi:hypothetical protein [Legionella sp. km772]|uniref:hypothetical protein n=1 Tax=Legionella sp. km772 TaxID=2498111 RepID=UPI000F8F69AD|nr:hypothetical protein [Legionella sp. km772]RUR05373.1 hypothetical protein ELY15_14385 [Legionella sp. km772]